MKQPPSGERKYKFLSRCIYLRNALGMGAVLFLLVAFFFIPLKMSFIYVGIGLSAIALYCDHFNSLYLKASSLHLYFLSKSYLTPTRAAVFCFLNDEPMEEVKPWLGRIHRMRTPDTQVVVFHSRPSVELKTICSQYKFKISKDKPANVLPKLNPQILVCLDPTIAPRADFLSDNLMHFVIPSCHRIVTIKEYDYIGYLLEPFNYPFQLIKSRLKPSPLPDLGVIRRVSRDPSIAGETLYVPLCYLKKSFPDKIKG